MGTSRICPKCDGHFDVANWVCPHCGEQFAAPRATAASRPTLLQRLAPYPGALTKIVIGVTATVYLVQIALGGSVWDMDVKLLVIMGAQVTSLVEAGQYWRMVTPILLHGGLLHILFNMFALFQLGPLVEQAYGRSRFLVLYLGAGVAGSLGSLLLGSGLPSIGASGAVCGFIGAMASWGKKRGGLQGAVIRRVMIQWAVFILILGLLMRGIDNWAHAGGFFGGMGLGLIITPKGFTLESGLRRRFWSAAAAGVVAVFVLCGATAAANVVRARHVEKIRPDIAKVDIAVEQAIRAYENSLDERMPAPTARAGLLSTADRLRDSTPRLGGDATRVVDMIEKALRARADDLKDLVGPDKPSGGASLAAMKKAVALWRDHLLAIGYR